MTSMNRGGNFLNGPDVVPRLQEVSRKRLPERVTADAFGNARPS